MFSPKKLLIIISFFAAANCKSESLPQSNPGGPAVSYSESHLGMNQSAVYLGVISLALKKVPIVENARRR